MRALHNSFENKLGAKLFIKEAAVAGTALRLGNPR
jgi:hypothetical protein